MSVGKKDETGYQKPEPFAVSCGDSLCLICLLWDVAVAVVSRRDLQRPHRLGTGATLCYRLQNSRHIFPLARRIFYHTKVHIIRAPLIRHLHVQIRELSPGSCSPPFVRIEESLDHLFFKKEKKKEKQLRLHRRHSPQSLCQKYTKTTNFILSAFTLS